jgi:hypothetical protein
MLGLKATMVCALVPPWFLVVLGERLVLFADCSFPGPFSPLIFGTSPF